MGRKILTEAGYDVVAVSNGAAAVKKIAEQKPDIIILDVYMPGYTGLEVCEKVRGSIETLKTPVLLTVGKVEPWKPEEANRVRADGVIVKPFEATDLLAIVKKFEERIGQAAAPPLVQRTASLQPADEIPDHPEPTIVANIPQATVEVPDHMATASAFSDLLAADPSHSLPHFNANQPGAGREIVPRSSANSAPIPDYELPVSWRKDSDPVAPSTMSVPVNEVAAAAPPPPSPPTPLRPRQIPVYEDREQGRSGLEVVPTAAPSSPEIEVPRDPQLEETAAETTRNTVVDSQEPDLVPTMQKQAEMGMVNLGGEFAPLDSRNNLSASVENPSDAPRGPRLVARTNNLDAGDTRMSESDFEARVAAAMASYNQATGSREAESQAVESAGREPSTPETPRSPGANNANAPATHTSAENDSTQMRTAGGTTPAAAPAETVKTSVAPPPVASHDSVADQLQAVVTAAAELGSDQTTIAQAVHRVMERLKPELVEEILKELKPKK
jgi:CheY-like chemotaxis protein